MWYFIRPKILEYKTDKVPNYHIKWLASEKNQNPQVEISEVTLQEPFRMWKLNQDLLHIQQSIVSMLYILIKS